jgi:VanZ family protein
MAVIFVLSSLPDVGPLPGGVSDKTAHFAGYAILGALVLRALAAARWSGVTWSAAGRAWVISALYGITDELHQSFVDHRTPTVDDWLADAAGAAAAVIAIALIAPSIVARITTAKRDGGPPSVQRRRKGREV